MSIDLEAPAQASAGPADARDGVARMLGLGASATVLGGLLVIWVVCLLWVGWPDGDGVGYYPDGLSDGDLALDRALVAGAGLLLLVVSAYLTRRLARSVRAHRAVTFVVAGALALPLAAGLGATAAYTLGSLEKAQAVSEPADIAPANLSAIFKSPCGYTWACVETLAKQQHVRLLLPPATDGWGLQNLSVKSAGILRLAFVRGPDICLLDTSQAPLATNGTSRRSTIAVRGTTGLLSSDPSGFAWSINWGEAGTFYRLSCPGSSDRTTMLDSLAVTG